MDNEYIAKRLDMLIAISLAQSGLTRKDISAILGVSEKTIQRMFSGHFSKIETPKS